MPAPPADSSLPRTCILIPTIERYHAAARLTVRLLDEYWSDHPKVYLCGVRDAEVRGLPLHDKESDWMAIVRRAANDLRERGYRRVFLILDDQGPMGPCHSRHLSETIPAWMTSLGASYISIRGWDHRRNSSGRNMGRRYLFLQRQSASFAWRFALHPALWDIDAMLQLLDIVMADQPRRSPWAFEREAGRVGVRLPSGWNEATFRVCGRAMSLASAPFPILLGRHVRDGLVRAIDRVLQESVLKRLPRRRRLGVLLGSLLRTRAVFFDGPYPMHFSGFLVAGKPNAELKRRLERQGMHSLANAIEAAAPSAG